MTIATVTIATTNPISRKLSASRSTKAMLALAFAAAAVTVSPAYAQIQTPGDTHLVPLAALPDAPGFSSSRDNEAPADAGIATSIPPVAGHFDKYIEPGQSAPPMSVGDKILMGLRDASSPSAVIGWAAAAGFEQAVNGSPNYGTNAGAYLQRFGASAARAGSEGVFSDSIMASVLHEDPRYYRMGPGHNPLKRATYAVSRVFITRTDSGRTTINAALLSGNLGGAYLTKAYYPPLNTSNTEVFKTYGSSIGGSALGFAMNEFFGGLLNHFSPSRDRQ